MKYTIEYDHRDQIWVARYDEYPGLAAHGRTPKEALQGAARAVAARI